MGVAAASQCGMIEIDKSNFRLFAPVLLISFSKRGNLFERGKQAVGVRVYEECTVALRRNTCAVQSPYTQFSLSRNLIESSFMRICFAVEATIFIREEISQEIGVYFW